MRPSSDAVPDVTSDAMPVVAQVAGPHATSIRRYLESVAGWQAVDERTAALVPPRLAVVDVAGAASAGDPSLPVILVVSGDDDPAEAARAAIGASRVVTWPLGRGGLAAAGADVGGGTASGAEAAARVIRVAGASGGVGTTTVALALGGIAAWGHTRTLLLTHGAVPAPGGRPVAPEDLGGTGVWDAADPAPGVPGLRVLRLARPSVDDPVDSGPADLTIRDLGTGEDTDVLVVRRDRAGIEAVGRSRAAVVVVVDIGPAPRRVVARALDGRRVVVLPSSARVAAAGLAGAVPARLPGAWLRRLVPVLGGRR